MTPTQFVDLETARSTRGARLVLSAKLPSPWSEAAKGLFRMKEIPFVAVRFDPADSKAVREWTRVRNSPVVMFDDEPARAGWAEILELTERLAPAHPMVPSSAPERARMFGLCHEVLGEGGLMWSSRLHTIHVGLESQGARGFPPLVASYLGKRYGYDAARAPIARARIDEGIALLVEALGAREYYLGDRPNALDVYSAAAVNIWALPPPEQCDMLPLIRAAFESMREELGPVPATLLAHRDRMYARHLELPMVL